MLEEAERSYARPVPYAPRPVVVLLGTAPAAGASFSLTSPGRDGWELFAVVARFTASAAVANRLVALEYDDGNGSVWYRSGVSAAIAAGATRTITWSKVETSPYADAASNLWAPLEPVEFPRGMKLQINVGAIDAADQLDRIVLSFRRQLYAAS